MVHEETLATFDRKFHVETTDGRFFPKRLVKTESLIALAERRAKAIQNAKGRIDSAEFAKRISGEEFHYCAAEGTVDGWLRRETCALLRRPLKSAKVEVFVGEMRNAFVDKWMIDESVADVINAVNLVWIPAKVVAELLGIPWNTFRKRLRMKRLGIEWSGDEVRVFAFGRFEQKRLHASMVGRLLRANHHSNLAEKYERRLKRVFGEANDARTAEQLAAEALAHWPDPDEADPPPAVPAEQATATPEQAGGRVGEMALAKDAGPGAPRKTDQHEQWAVWKAEGLSDEQVAKRHFEVTGQKVTGDAVRKARKRLADPDKIPDEI